MSFLDSLFTETGNTTEVSRTKLSSFRKGPEKKFYNEIDKAVVKSSTKDGDTFLSMCFIMKDGSKKRGYLSKYSSLEAGDEVDPKSIEVIELEQDGELLKPRYDGEILE